MSPGRQLKHPLAPSVTTYLQEKGRSLKLMAVLLIEDDSDFPLNQCEARNMLCGNGKAPCVDDD